MHNLDRNEVLSAFFRQLRAAPESVLLLDYDGTLAPFHRNRAEAYPYPGVLSLLERIAQSNRTNVSIISGRPAVELKTLLRPLTNLELWGSHGLEHELSDGTCRELTIHQETLRILNQACEWLAAEGLSARAEIKPGGIAVHWRGMAKAEAEEIEAAARNGFTAFAERSELKLLPFEAGLELRVAHPNKGDVVNSILGSLSLDVRIAYLGDDLTDEDAFHALTSRGLTVLVRPTFRETRAQTWLHPPDELVGFLQEWWDCISA